MRKVYTVEERTQVRAYYAWLNGSTCGELGDWLSAEAKEIQLAERRVKDATKRTVKRIAGAWVPPVECHAALH